MRRMYTTQRLLGTVACVGAMMLAAPALAQDAAAEPEVIELFEEDGGAKSDQKIETTETGEFDLNITELEITKVLQVLSIEGQKNIIASRGVENAKVSASLYKVSFEEALTSILEPNGFGYIEEGNFIYVMTKAELQERKDANRKPVTKILRLDYLRADEAAAFVTPLLSDNGSIIGSGNVEDGLQPTLDNAGADNYAGPPTLVIRDYEEAVEEIVAIIEDLDKQPKQVIIEATILNTSLSENNQFGVDFSLFTDLTVASPLDIIDNAITGGAVDNQRLGAVQSNVGDVVNQAGGVKLGFVAGDAAVFVSALDSVNDTTVIASPKITVLDRNQSDIQVGERVPFLTTTVSETTSTQTIEFLDTGTQLSVRPFVASDGKIRLELRPSVSSAESVDVGGGQTAPQEDTVEMITNVIVESGQTIVLGGLFTDSTSVGRSQVPGLGNIPLLGAAFQGQDDVVSRSEIIFLVKATVVENETLIDLGKEGTARVGVARLAEREQLLPWSRGKLTASHMMSARKSYEEALTLTGDAREGKMDEAEYSVNMALHMNPSMVDALILKEKITGEAAYIKYEESIINQTFEAVLNAEMKAIGIQAMPEPEAELPELPTEQALVQPEPLTEAEAVEVEVEVEAEAEVAEAHADADFDADAEAQAQAAADAAFLEAALADEFGEATAEATEPATQEPAVEAEEAEAEAEDEVIVIELQIEGEPETTVDASESTDEPTEPAADDDVIVIQLDQPTETETQAGVETETE